MKKNYIAKTSSLYSIFMAVLCCFFVACSDNANEETNTNYNPELPVSVTRFAPIEGTYAQEMVIYGNNFGIDTTKISVTIGGRKAKLVYAKSDSICCLVPYKAESGHYNVQVTMGDKDLGTKSVVANARFTYISSLVVRTLVGHRNSNDSQGWKDGTFGTGDADGSATGFRQAGYLKFDPQNPDHLYVAYEDFDNNGYGIQLIDLKEKTVKTVMHGSCFDGKRLRSIDFTLKGDMVVATDRDDKQLKSPSVWIVKRDADGSFTDSSAREILAAYKQCNTAVIHPIGGELYFNSYNRSAMFRMDMNKYYDTVAAGGTWKPNWADKNYERWFMFPETGWNFNITIHPSGKYAYVIVLNQHCIYRMDYDTDKKQFSEPYLVAGQRGIKAWADGKGDGTQMNYPYQGVFVKNKEYVEQGREDVYDFYFCDYDNYCIRYLTPDGYVKTYAGRGATSSMKDNKAWGPEDGDLKETARFGSPTGIAYDERTGTFYVLDMWYRSIRTIGK